MLGPRPRHGLTGGSDDLLAPGRGRRLGNGAWDRGGLDVTLVPASEAEADPRA